MTAADLAALDARLKAVELFGPRLAALEAAVKALTPPPVVIPPVVVPPTGITYYATNFADGTRGPLGTYSYTSPVRATWAPSADYHEPDSPWSIKCVVPAVATDDAGALTAWFGRGALAAFPLDPTLDQDLFEQVRFVIGPGSLAVVPSGGQLKVHKSVYGTVGSNTNGWVMSEFAPGEAAAVVGKLFSECEIWGSGGNGTPFPWPGAAVEGQVYDVVYRYHRYTALNVGTVAIWVNGVKVLDSPKWPYLGLKRPEDFAAGLCLQSGAVYAQKTTGPVTVYVLSTRATNFPIGAAIASAA